MTIWNLERGISWLALGRKKKDPVQGELLGQQPNVGKKKKPKGQNLSVHGGLPEKVLVIHIRLRKNWWKPESMFGPQRFILYSLKRIKGKRWSNAFITYKEFGHLV